AAWNAYPSAPALTSHLHWALRQAKGSSCVPASPLSGPGDQLGLHDKSLPVRSTKRYPPTAERISVGGTTSGRSGCYRPRLSPRPSMSPLSPLASQAGARQLGIG